MWKNSELKKEHKLGENGSNSHSRLTISCVPGQDVGNLNVYSTADQFVIEIDIVDLVHEFVYRAADSILTDESLGNGTSIGRAGPTAGGTL